VAERHVAGTRLSAFLDDELSDDDAIVAARHLAACTRCLAELEGLRATRDALRALPQLQAPVLTAGIERRSQRMQRTLARLRLVAVACAVPVVVVAVLYVAGEDPGDVEPQSELFLVEYLGRTGGGPVPVPVGSG
jgi:anti-sigma factor RsiW